MSQRKRSALLIVLCAAASLVFTAAIPSQASRATQPQAVPLASAAAYAVQVVAANNRTCALTQDGQVKCWGEGYLGAGPWGKSITPVDVPGLVGATALAAGRDHTCALLGDGRVKCWGLNGTGQLGDGTRAVRWTPVEVVGLTDAVRLGAGTEHTCAVTRAGALKCWGWNEYGQVGDGTTIWRSTPVTVSGLTSGVTSVALGYTHTCAAVTGADGKSGAWCWGANWEGQLGDGTTTAHLTPAAVYALGKGVVQVAVGSYHSCALLLGGELKCWGGNGSGQLGLGTRTGHVYAVNVSGLSTGVLSVSASGMDTCAVMDSNQGAKVACWGGNTWGQVGDGTYSRDYTSVADRLSPFVLSELTGRALSVTVSGLHACATVNGGGIKCWGNNAEGELGYYSLGVTALPVEVGGLSGVTAGNVAAGGRHSCALTNGDSSGYGVKCWGDNGSGQLGDGTRISRNRAATVVGLSHGVRAIAAGNAHTCAVLSSGAVKCWGSNGYGALGNCGSGSDYLYPVDVAGLTGATSITAGIYHTCAGTANGQVKCWGNNDHGQVGNGTTNNYCGPKTVSSGELPLWQVSAGGQHTCAVTSEVTGDSWAVCWGANDWGQLGDGTNKQRLTPVAVKNLTAVQAVAAGGAPYWYWSEPLGHTCALLYSGDVACWGTNGSGQLGSGTTISSWTPVPVVGLSGAGSASGVTAGAAHTCALVSGSPETRDGVKCWGSNRMGQLGDGTTGGYADVPRLVDALGYQVEGVAAGAQHTCAVMSTGRVECWGSNDWGQTGGNGGWTPLDVPGFGGVPAFTPTLSPTVPASPTSLPTETETPTPTETATPTATATATATETPSPTPTVTMSPTATPTATGTPTSTPTAARLRVWLPLICR